MGLCLVALVGRSQAHRKYICGALLTSGSSLSSLGCSNSEDEACRAIEGCELQGLQGGTRWVSQPALIRMRVSSVNTEEGQLRRGLGLRQVLCSIPRMGRAPKTSQLPCHRQRFLCEWVTIIILSSCFGVGFRFSALSTGLAARYAPSPPPVNKLPMRTAWTLSHSCASQTER